MPSSQHAERLALLKASQLSAANTEATREQRDLEALAIRLYQTPEVKKAKHETGAFWMERKIRPSAEALQSFDAGVDDFAFHCVLEAANSDTDRPKVLRVECEPHRWFGMDVPGSRRGGNNADNAYRIVPVDTRGRFEIIGQVSPVPPADVTFTLIGHSTMSKTIQTIEFRDLEVGPDGVFVVTVDPEPANGRRNHLQSKDTACYVFIRDSLTDWETQQVNLMVARRLDPTGAPPPDFEELVRRCVQCIKNDQPYYRDVLDMPHAYPLNTFSKPFNPGQFGGLVTQRGSSGYFTLADDEAIVITVTTAGAEYLSLMVHDPWWRTIPFWYHTSSLSKSQAVANPDGSYTFVVCPTDPDVHNWIDTAGLHEGIFYMRWQGLPPGTPYEGGPEILQQTVVNKAQLRSVLPAGTRFMTSVERMDQIVRRLNAVRRRWVDC